MKIYFSLLFALVMQLSFAQNKIMVHVNDQTTGEPLIGASVYWTETMQGTATDIDGVAFISGSKKYPDKLVVSYVGYNSDTVELKKHLSHLYVHLSEKIVLDVTEVIGKRKDEYIRTLDPAKTEVISQNQLRKAACCNLSESFQTNASAQVNFEDAVTGAKQIELLGLKGIYVQNTIENTPALRGLSSSFALDNVPAPWIKSIELAKGTPSVRSGFEGITGSININYKEPANLSPFYFDLFANHTGRFEGNMMTGINKNKWGTGLYFNGALTKDHKDRNGDSFYDQPQVNQFNAMNSWTFDGEKVETRFLIKGLHEQRKSGQISLPENQDELYKINIKTDRIEGIGKVGIFLPGGLERSLGITASGFWHNQKGLYGSNNYDGLQGSFFGNALFQTVVKNTNHTIFAGGSIMYDMYDENVNGTPLKRTDIVPGISAEYTYKHLDKITLVAGLRADFPNHFNAQINPRIHFRYEPVHGTQIRLAGGRGFRIPNIYAENIYMFASSRAIHVTEKPGFESAWNSGISLIQEIHIGPKLSNIAIDFFHTRFTNQVIVDIENGNNKADIYNLDGKSYSNSFMIEWSIEPVTGFDMKFAYRLEDVRQTMKGKLIRKSMIPPHRGLAALSYKTNDEKWMFTTNLNIHSKMKYPASFNDEHNQFSPASAMLGAQITRYQGNFEFFIGGENLLNVRQKFPIIGYENPFGEIFDTHQIWGPVIGPIAYGGVRFNLNSK